MAGAVHAAEPTVNADGATLRPTWEVGIGLSALSLPDYRGADTRHRYLFPIPYVIYRSPRLSLDRGGLKADLFELGPFELDFSINLSAPARSDERTARAGMESLRPALEIGPQLIAKLWRSPGGDARLQFQVPLRYAFVLSRNARDAGLVLHPRMNLDVRNVFGLSGWGLGVVAGPMFATARHHEYFYTVDPSEATASRPAYRAGGGYSGMQWTVAVSRRFPHHWLGAFVRVDQLQGAVFADSPLVRRRNSVSAGLAVSWIFAESGERIARP